MKAKISDSLLIEMASIMLRCLHYAESYKDIKDEYNIGYHRGKALANAYVLGWFGYFLYVDASLAENLDEFYHGWTHIFYKKELVMSFSNRPQILLMKTSLFDKTLKNIKKNIGQPCHNGETLAEDIEKECRRIS